jgi:hypothetical protein
MKQQQTLNQQIAALERMGPTELRAQYLKVFGEPTRSANKQYLYKKVAWRIQSLAEGGLSERAKRRAEELARDADIRTTAPRAPSAPERSIALRVAKADGCDRLPIPGTVLTRTYRGQHVAVTVLSDGFQYEGQTYKSLSAIAKAVTGSHWNGYLFFGLKGN